MDNTIIHSPNGDFSVIQAEPKFLSNEHLTILDVVYQENTIKQDVLREGDVASFIYGNNTTEQHNFAIRELTEWGYVEIRDQICELTKKGMRLYQ